MFDVINFRTKVKGMRTDFMFFILSLIYFCLRNVTRYVMKEHAEISPYFYL